MDETEGESGNAKGLSAQDLVAALQAKVQVDFGATADPEVHAALAPLLAALQQAHGVLAARATASVAVAHPGSGASAETTLATVGDSGQAGEAPRSRANVSAIKSAFEKTCLGVDEVRLAERSSPY